MKSKKKENIIEKKEHLAHEKNVHFVDLVNSFPRSEPDMIYKKLRNVLYCAKEQKTERSKKKEHRQGT